ncbi:MAG: 5-formyltetrahydrofolate cyclo-ligase [Proteobacteria bacterium]|nr:5-formyltetrahydrofolate cyclo-ligase [Pseudomonadota bacterium]
MTSSIKSLLRKTYLPLRAKLPKDYKEASAKLIRKHLKKLEAYRYAKKIALYQAVKGEISLDSIWTEAPLQGKFCYFPVVTDNTDLLFLPATPATPFIKNRYNIDEPNVNLKEAISVEELDIIFLPLVLFDNQGNRLGMGAGFYDRTLAKIKESGAKKPLLIGLGYEFQRYPRLPTDIYDIRLDLAITPRQIYWFDKN